MSPMALSACATAGSSSEVEQLRAQVRALREDNNRLEQKIARLEAPRLASEPVALSTAKKAAVESVDPGLPALTVVKLKPKKEAAPKIDTKVSVIEPGPEVIAELTAAAPPETDADIDANLFDRGMAALKTGNVEGGVAQLQRFAAESPKDPRADNALYNAGLGQMGLGDYDDAAKTFQQVSDRYPAGDAVTEAMLKLGECRVKLNRPADARAVYQQILASWPESPAALQARSRLASLPASP